MIIWSNTTPSGETAPVSGCEPRGRKRTTPNLLCPMSHIDDERNKGRVDKNRLNGMERDMVLPEGSVFVIPNTIRKGQLCGAMERVLDLESGRPKFKFNLRH
ncbi:gamma-glutamylaminecyclotransferase isoform X4 [Petaurus breviceps papuanus]|uniref:gamma-glutamylaminecyclotransferase isoform X4 n=1 Tax=Petaurus breviceps papuanus TaxID=3040969 RepID=UPI0036DE4CB1